MSTNVDSATRITASVLVVWALAWLLLNVNTYAGRQIEKGTASLAQMQTHPLTTSAPRSQRDGADDAAFEYGARGGFEIIEACGPPAYGIPWVGLWLVTALIGGMPTAVLVRSLNRH